MVKKLQRMQLSLNQYIQWSLAISNFHRIKQKVRDSGMFEIARLRDSGSHLEKFERNWDQSFWQKQMPSLRHQNQTMGKKQWKHVMKSKLNKLVYFCFLEKSGITACLHFSNFSWSKKVSIYWLNLCFWHLDVSK